MAARKSNQIKLELTELALADLVSIEAFSIENWGKRVAKKYLADIESRLNLIHENPSLLTTVEGLPEPLQCYPAREHVLIFDVQPKSLVLLTIIHGSRDIPTRLSELAPTLAAEVDMLHAKLGKRSKKSR